MKKASILIVEDQVLMRETLANLLKQAGKFGTIENTGDSSTAIELIQHSRPDILILDINMQPLDGFEILKIARKFSPGTKVIAVSVHTQISYVKKMFREGAKGYVTKNSSAEELVIAIEEVLKGNNYTCREIKDILLNISMSEEQNEHKVSTLTTREMEIIEYLKAGLSSKEIGDKLFITAKTVEVHRHNLLKKLGVKNSVALIEYANKHGL